MFVCSRVTLKYCSLSRCTALSFEFFICGTYFLEKVWVNSSIRGYLYREGSVEKSFFAEPGISDGCFGESLLLLVPGVQEWSESDD